MVGGGGLGAASASCHPIVWNVDDVRSCRIVPLWCVKY